MLPLSDYCRSQIYVKSLKYNIDIFLRNKTHAILLVKVKRFSAPFKWIHISPTVAQESTVCPVNVADLGKKLKKCRLLS